MFWRKLFAISFAISGPICYTLIMKLNADFNLITKGETVAVALSGGKDSMSLLHLLLQNAERLQITVKAINVEHGIRGEESLSDTAFCVSQSAALGVSIKTYSVDAPKFAREHGVSLEEAARTLRYDCFKDALDCGFADKIATAHHKNDQAETILLNVFRGSGLSGARGMEHQTQSGSIIRPLLSVLSAEIDLYADFYKIPFVTDSSNLDTTISRNYLRREILPRVLSRFPGAVDGIVRFGNIAGADDEYLYALAKEQLAIDGESASIAISAPSPIFARAAILAMKHIGVLKDYTARHVASIEKLKTLETGKEISLPSGGKAVREYDKIVFYASQPETPFFFALEEGSFVAGKYEITIEKIDLEKFRESKKSRYSAINGSAFKFVEIYADCEKCANAEIRPPKKGDIFKKLGGGSKSLKKHLIDRKIPKTVRESLPVIARGANVLAVCGVEISETAKVDENTASVFKITTSKI